MRLTRLLLCFKIKLMHMHSQLGTITAERLNATVIREVKNSERICCSLRLMCYEKFNFNRRSNL